MDGVATLSPTNDLLFNDIISIGVWLYYNSGVFNSVIDNLRLFDRDLSNEEVKELYNMELNILTTEIPSS